MELITKTVESEMNRFALYSQDGQGKNATCTAKFFICVGAWTWYVLEYDGKDTCFGIVVNGYGDCEYGYFSMKELSSVRTKLGLGVERDTAFKPCKVYEINDEHVKQFIKQLG